MDKIIPRFHDAHCDERKVSVKLFSGKLALKRRDHNFTLTYTTLDWTHARWILQCSANKSGDTISAKVITLLADYSNVVGCHFTATTITIYFRFFPSL